VGAHGRVRRRLRGHILDQVAQLGVALLADGRLERDRVAGRLAQLLDLQRRQPELLADLLVGRLAAERVPQLVRDADELVGLVAYLDWLPARPRLVSYGAQHGLADPPRRVGRKLEPAPVV